MEADEYGLTRGTCFVVCRLEVVAVAGCCGFRGVFSVRRDFVFFIFIFLFFERTRPAASMRPPWVIYLSTIKRIKLPPDLPGGYTETKTKQSNTMIGIFYNGNNYAGM